MWFCYFLIGAGYTTGPDSRRGTVKDGCLPRISECLDSAHADEFGAGAHVDALLHGLVAVPTTVDSLAVTGVDGDVCEAGTTVGVVGDVTGLGLGSRHLGAQGLVALGPAVVVDANSLEELVTSMVQSWVTPI